MNVTLPKNDDFILEEVKIFNGNCVLIYPKSFPKWNDYNKYFRSSLWRKSDFKPVSLLWRKFTNLGEQPEFEPIDFRNSLQFIQKIDGSCLGWSKFNGNLISRTRRTTDARSLPNGHEIDLFIQKYPKLIDNKYINSENFTILTEWTTPQNVIVYKESQEPKLWLTGIVRHEDYSYLPQSELDLIAEEISLDRPKRYNFNTFEEMLRAVELFEDSEGIVVYANNGQVLKKCKSPRYLMLHKLKSELSSIEKVIDLFIELNYPKYNDFYLYIAQTFDFELAKMSIPQISKCCDAYEKVQKIIFGMQVFIRDVLGHLPDRKSKALKIIESYGITNRASFVFALMDKGSLEKENIKKLLFQVLKYG